MGDDPDLDPDITRLFFENNVLKTDPAMLNEHGLKYAPFILLIHLFFNIAKYYFVIPPYIHTYMYSYTHTHTRTHTHISKYLNMFFFLY